MEFQSVTIKPVQKELIHAKIADAIMSYINGNQLKCGDKLPPERELAAQFATSRNSVREALKVLEANQIVEIRQGSGIFIRSKEDANSFYVKLWRVNYIELLKVKEVLEGALVYDLCGKLTAEQLQLLEAQLIQIEESVKIGKYYHKADRTFHNLLWSFSQNKTMAQLLADLFEKLRSYWHTLEGEESMWLSSMPYHRQLFEGLKAGRWAETEDALRKISQIDQDITIWMQEAAKPFK